MRLCLIFLQQRHLKTSRGGANRGRGGFAKRGGRGKNPRLRSPLFPSDLRTYDAKSYDLLYRVSVLSPKTGVTTRHDNEKEGEPRTRKFDVAHDSESGGGLTEREIRLQRRHHLSSTETSPDSTGDLRSSRKRLRRTIEEDDDSDDGSVFDDEDLEERGKESTKSEGVLEPQSMFTA